MSGYRLKYGQWEVGVRERPLIIGRGRDCDLRLEDPAISRRHAELRVEGGVLWLEDCSSRNGVYLDGARVRGRTRVPAGAELRLGRHHVQVVADTVSAGAPDEGGESSLFTQLEDPKARTSGAVETGPAAALSPRERQVVSMIARGFTQKEAADAMDVSTKTIEGYLRRVREKLGVRTRADLVAYARVAGIASRTDGES